MVAIYLDEDFISKQVDEFRDKNLLPSGVAIPQFVTYRTAYEFDKLVQLGVCNIHNFHSARLQSVKFGFFALSCLSEEEYRFVVSNCNELYSFYNIKR